MDYLGLDEGQLERCLRAVKTVAIADGAFEERERALIEAAARALRLECDADALEPATPEELAEAIADPEARTRVVQAQIVMALMDGEVKGAELEVIQRFGEKLGVSERRIENLEQIMKGQLKYLQFDLMRRSEMVQVVMRDVWRKKGLGGVWETMGGLAGLYTDGEHTQRFVALGELPEGTLGREYFVHMSDRGFSFPGEKKGFPEGFMKHDLCHVLGDYDTDPAGECEVVAFISGFMKTDPFWYLFMIAVHMHLGIEVFKDNELGKMDFHPERVMRALHRGMLVNADLYDPSIDWWEHFATPLETLRARWNIVPKDAALEGGA